MEECGRCGLRDKVKLVIFALSVVALISVGFNICFYLRQRDENRVFAEMLFLSFHSAESHLSIAIGTADGSCLTYPLDNEEAFLQLKLASIELRRISAQVRSQNRDFNNRYRFTFGDFEFLADILSESGRVANYERLTMHGIKSDYQISDDEILFLSKLHSDIERVLDSLSNSSCVDGIRTLTNNISMNQIAIILDDFFYTWSSFARMGLLGMPEENPFILLDIRYN